MGRAMSGDPPNPGSARTSRPETDPPAAASVPETSMPTGGRIEPRASDRDDTMGLVALLRSAEGASPLERIEWRDRIAAHGAEAIQAVGPWLENPVLAAFAIRVIERAGSAGHLTLATSVLRAARSRVPERERGDVDWALQRLRGRRSTESKKARPARPPARPVPQIVPRRPYLPPVPHRRPV